MIIVDFDSIKNNQKALNCACMIVRSSLKPVENAETLTFAPTEAIYWFSKDKISKDDLEKKHLPTLGANFGQSGNILEYLEWMMNDIDKHSKKCGMGSFKMFHNTKVITDFDATSLQKLGANVIQSSIIGAF